MTEQPENTAGAAGVFSMSGSATREPIAVEAMRGGGSCEIFSVSRGAESWVLRRAPRHASSQTAHDVLREFRILDAIKDAAGRRSPGRSFRATTASVFGAPFYVMDRVDGMPIRDRLPDGLGGGSRAARRSALEQLIDALVAVHAVDWKACGLGDLAHVLGDYLKRQISRWLSQLHSYGGRELAGRRAARRLARVHRPPDQPPALFHGDYKLDNVLYATRTAGAIAGDRRLGDVVDRRPARRSGLGADLPSRARRHHAARDGEGAALRPGIPAEQGRARRALRDRRPDATRRRSGGTTSSPAGSSRSRWKAATPSSCAASRASRSTNTSARKPICCWPVPS